MGTFGYKTMEKYCEILSLKRRPGRDVQPRWPKHTQDIPRYAQDISKIFPRYAQDIPKIFPRYAQDMPKICPWYTQDMHIILKIYPRYTKILPDMPKNFPRYAQVITKIWPIYPLYIPKIYSMYNLSSVQFVHPKSKQSVQFVSVRFVQGES